MTSPHEEIAFQTGYVLVGYSFKQRDEDWLLVVRLNGRLDGRKVAFISCKDYFDCWEQFYLGISGEKMTLKLKPDRFA